jgi:DnaK suppressor protein
MLSLREKAELETHIRDTIVQLERQIEELREKTRPIAPDCSLGRLTRLEAMGEKQVNETVLRESEQRLIRLRNALSHLERPDFGRCVECDEPIGFQRLKVRPESVRCIECAELTEQ